MKLKVVVAGFVLAILFTTAWGQRPGNFRVIGPGGGGAMFNPTISPHDTNTVLISCDMSGSYITHDGGTTWRMFNLRGVVDFFAFDPKDPQYHVCPCHGPVAEYRRRRALESDLSGSFHGQRCKDGLGSFG